MNKKDKKQKELFKKSNSRKWINHGHHRRFAAGADVIEVQHALHRPLLHAPDNTLRLRCKQCLGSLRLGGGLLTLIWHCDLALWPWRGFVHWPSSAGCWGSLKYYSIDVMVLMICSPLPLLAITFQSHLNMDENILKTHAGGLHSTSAKLTSSDIYTHQ